MVEETPPWLPQSWLDNAISAPPILTPKAATIQTAVICTPYKLTHSGCYFDTKGG